MVKSDQELAMMSVVTEVETSSSSVASGTSWKGAALEAVPAMASGNGASDRSSTTSKSCDVLLRRRRELI